MTPAKQNQRKTKPRAAAAPASAPEGPTPIGPIVVLTAIGFLLRLWYLNQPMRYDEAVTYLQFASRPWAELVSTYTYPNNHVFHTVLVKLSVTLVGNASWAIRLPAFLAGVALVPVSFFVGRRIVGDVAAYFGAALIAASGALVLYSTNARGYILVSLATLVLLDLLQRIRTQSSTALWIAVVATASLGLWTIPIMLYPAGGLALWFALSARRDAETAATNLRRLGIAFAATTIVTTLLYMPILLRSGFAPLISNSFVHASTWSTFFNDLAPHARQVFDLLTLGAPRVVAFALVGLVFLGLLTKREVSATTVSLAGPMLAWCAVILLATHRVPFTRVWLFLFPLAALSAGLGIARFTSRWRPAVTGAVAVVVALALSVTVIHSGAVTSSRETGTLPDADAITQALTPLLHPGDRVFAPIPSNAPLHYAFVRAGVDTSYFSPTAEPPLNAYLIVNTGEGMSMASPVVDPQIKYFPKAKLIAKYPAAELYQLVRVASGT